MLNNDIRLVCFTSEDDKKAIVGFFNKLGINSILPDGPNWLSCRSDLRDELVILVLPEKNIPNGIAKKVLSFNRHNVFTVFFTPASNDIIPVLEASYDFCVWPCDPLELSFRINRFTVNCGKSADLEKIGSESTDWRRMNLVGESAICLNIQSFILKASICDAPVLIESETGCGKEVTARAIHYLGNRKEFPFIPMNCGAVPDQLFENELFGHEKGAYTDARNCQIGLTMQADGGTLFLDEIEALTPKGQVTLLRFIEDNQIRPLGAARSKKVNVRIIAASNICLSELVAKGQFRQDLLFRLNLLHLNLPPLRERREDIQLLAQHFLEKYRHQYHQPRKRFHPDTVNWMHEHHWPGNIRELENFVHRSFLLSQDNEIRVTPLEHGQNSSRSRRKLFDRRQNFTFDATFNEAKDQAINHFEQNYLTWLIASSNGNVTQAADKAQKERRALGKLLKKHAIKPVHFRSD